MKKVSLLIILAVVFSSTTFSGELTPVFTRNCCISGVYEGWQKDSPSATCTDPGSGKFTMYLYQEKECGGKIWGKIVDPANPAEPMSFSGTVKPGKDGCCVIEGTASKTGESNEFTGTICKVHDKWTVEKGKYRNSRGCSGVFGMTWVRDHLLLRPAVRKK